ncbi:MAG TPA: SDR family oxidoreductase [Steroidobacteraceae bacterium]|nr:SDR family oxidoreductase [Steroidobacteraceae bacterium]
MTNKVCVVTGGTDGIGKAAAYALAAQGAKVLIHGRDTLKGQQAVAELKARSGNPAIEFLQADFGSLADVRRLAASVSERAPRLDVLINNAGGFFARRSLSQDGFELTWAVNHLAPFLLTHLLMDRLKGASQARIVTTASSTHQRARIRFDDLQTSRQYTAMGAYSQSKLANILFTRALSRRLQGTGITATCLHPGLVRTAIGRNIDSVVTRSLLALVSRFARSPEKGAQTLVYLATSAQVQGASGGYYFDCKATPPSPAAQDDEVAERLWDISAGMVGVS